MTDEDKIFGMEGKWAWVGFGKGVVEAKVERHPIKMGKHKERKEGHGRARRRSISKARVDVLCECAGLRLEWKRVDSC